jgi:hypothetical protein
MDANRQRRRPELYGRFAPDLAGASLLKKRPLKGQPQLQTQFLFAECRYFVAFLTASLTSPAAL